MNKINTTQINKAKAFSCVDVLEHFGHLPAVERSNGELVYFSPFRNEKTPSFFVNVSKNVFADHGGENYKGDVISLYRFLTGKSFQTTIFELSENKINISLNQNVNYKPLKVEAGGIELISVSNEIRNPSLILFSENRGISLDTLNRYCKEIKYKQKNTGRVYSSIGFKNIKDGYELRAAGFKSCLGSKEISIIKGDENAIVFEGFFNFLSFIEIYKTLKGKTAIILNTTSKVRAIDYKQFNEVHCFLDNDKSGIKALEYIKTQNNKVFNWVDLYGGYNDLNQRLTVLGL